MFEQAIFFVRSGTAVSEKELLRQAGAAAEEKCAHRRRALHLLSFITGAASTGLLWFFFSLL